MVLFSNRPLVTKIQEPIMAQPFVIFSAASAQAFAVAQTAIDQNIQIKAVLRPGKVSSLVAPHELVYADLKDVESLKNALVGARAAFFHLPIPAGPGESELHLGNLLNAAKKTKLPVLIFSSSSFADDSFSSTPLIDGNRYAVKQVLESGVPSIVLKPGLYLENLQVPFFIPNLAQGVLDYPPMSKDQPMSWTSHWDQALLSVAALSKPELVGNAYNIASSQPVTPAELAAILGEHRGNSKLQFKAITPSQFAERVGNALNNPSLNFLLADLYRSINQQTVANLIVDTDKLQTLFGVRLKSIRERIDAWSR
jgi:NAD(P)H dehydrogenase (quinone)